jgi:hypothetical protein
MLPKTFFVKHLCVTTKKYKVKKMWAISVIFKITVLSKQSPIGRKFAQSGHPGGEPATNFVAAKSGRNESSSAQTEL